MLAACGKSENAADLSSGSGSGSAVLAANSGKQEAWIEAGEDAIKTKLKDPDSAKFRNAQFFAGSGHPIACGEVNSKNSFGAYGGYERFIAAGDVIQVIESEMAPGEMDKTWAMLCR